MKIIVTGKLKDEYFRKMETMLLKDITKKADITIIELKDEKIPENASEKVESMILKKEGEAILSKISKTDYVVSLCVEGKIIDTKHFNGIIKSQENLVLIIGGSLGLSDEVKKRSNEKISFSNMTLTHQMIRIVLLDSIKNAY